MLQGGTYKMNKELIKLPMAAEKQTTSCCADEQSQECLEDTAQDAAGSHWVAGQLETAVGPVYQVSTTLSRADLLGSFKARWGVGRMTYTVPPGLYAVGQPDKTSPVLVSANYKLSFDYLRKELSGLNVWVLVLDTKGINVWCAAGKGSFGTDEVVKMVSAAGLSRLVSHRTLILPQLAAPGVSAHEVRRRCGFKVIYGPVRAADIPAFLKAGNKAEAAMRRTRFTLRDRLVLTPVELTALIKPAIGLVFYLFILNLASVLINNSPVGLLPLLNQTFSDFTPFFLALLVGAVLVPALLPYIPGRAFAWKGLVMGVLLAFGYTLLAASPGGWLQTTAYFLAIPAITAFLGMNFTGSTTYTSLSGVFKEMNVALPLIIISACLGLIALTAAYFV